MADYLVVDLDQVLNESEHGRAGLESMRALLKRAELEGIELKATLERAPSAAAKAKAKAALLEHRKRIGAELDKRRAALKKALLGLARRVAKDVAAERGVELVLERRAVVACPEERDITAEVIAGVDATRLRNRGKSD